MRLLTLLFCFLVSRLMAAYGQTEKTIKHIVNFPKITGPIQITDGPEEHFFASYYGINSFSRSQQYVTVNEENGSCFYVFN